MSAWYTTHFEKAIWREGVDSENLTLELFEELAAGAPEPARVAELSAALLSMPWNDHLGDAFAQHGFHVASGTFGGANGRPRPSAEALLASLCRVGAGANPMPFPRPEIEPCEMLHRQSVSTARGEHTLEHVLVTRAGAYGFVRNLQNCIYGKVRHGIELEDVAASSTLASSTTRQPPAEQQTQRTTRFGSFFGGSANRALAGGGGGTAAQRHAQQQQQQQQAALSAATQRRWRATGAQVAIKCIERPKYEAHVARHRGRLNEDPIKEVAVMQHIGRAGGAPHVLSILGCYADDDTVYVVLPFCPHGDLFGLVEQRGGLPERTAVGYFQQILKGLETLHELGLAHHDMSLENLMLDDEKRAVIIDFGMAVKTRPTPRSFLAPNRGLPPTRATHPQRGPTQALGDDAMLVDSAADDSGISRAHFSGRRRPGLADRNYFSVPLKYSTLCGQSLFLTRKRRTSSPVRQFSLKPARPSRGWPCRCGKLLYMAPELYEPTSPFDVYAADVWALGIILFLLLTGMPPWDAATGPASTDMRYVYVRDGRLHELLRTWNIHLSEHAPDLLQRLLDANPETRITIPEVKTHPWWTTLVASN